MQPAGAVGVAFDLSEELMRVFTGSVCFEGRAACGELRAQVN
jgi:hypothetical protein